MLLAKEGLREHVHCSHMQPLFTRGCRTWGLGLKRTYGPPDRNASFAHLLQYGA